MGDAHQRVIERVAEEERGAAILAPDDEIADVVRQVTLCAKYQIVEFDAPPGRNPKAQAGLAALRQAAGALIGGKRTAGARVARWSTGGQLRAPRQIQL